MLQELTANTKTITAIIGGKSDLTSDLNTLALMGNDRINTIMKKMAATAGLSGKKTNHSAKKTM